MQICLAYSHWYAQYIIPLVLSPYLCSSHYESKKIPFTGQKASSRKKTQTSPIPYQQRTLLFIFWSNIRCEVGESAHSRRGDGAQGSRQGAADEWEKRRDVVIGKMNNEMIYRAKYGVCLMLLSQKMFNLWQMPIKWLSTDKILKSFCDELRSDCSFFM